MGCACWFAAALAPLFKKRSLCTRPAGQMENTHSLATMIRKQSKMIIAKINCQATKGAAFDYT